MQTTPFHHSVLFVLAASTAWSSMPSDTAAPPTDSATGEREAVLETQEVRSTRSTAPSPRRVIGREEIARAGSLAELLAREPGLVVQRAGGLGSHARIAMRGSPSEQVEVLLDGHPLGGSTGSSVDLGPIPLDGLERIEITQAGADGSSTAPRIELRSRQGWNRRGVSARAGSFGERALSAWWSDSAGRVSIAAWTESADNDYVVPWDNGTRYNTADDRDVKLSNNDYVGRGLSLALRPVESFDAHLRLDDTRRGVSAPGWDESDARLEGGALQGGARWRATSWTLQPEASLSGRWFRSEWTDPDKLAGWDVDRGSEEEGLDGTLALGLRRDAQDWCDWRIGADLRLESSERTSTGTADVAITPSGARRTFGLEAGWTGRSAGARAGAEATLRGEWMTDTRDWSEDLGKVRLDDDVGTDWRGIRSAARLWTRPLADWTLWTAVARRVRPPDFREWMGDNGFTLRTPDLAVETSTTGEIGTSLELGPVEGGLTAWIASYEDPIEAYQRGSTPLVAHRNAPGYLARGVDGELALDARIARLSARGTLQDAAIDDPNPALDGNRPRRLPTWKATLSAASGSWLGASVGSDLELQGGTYASELNRPTDERDGRSLLGAWVRWSRGRFGTHLAVRNLLDEHPEDHEDIPLAGRQWSLRIDIELSRTASNGDHP